MNSEYVLPKVLKEALARKGWSFRELSLRSGVPVQTLYHWANGQLPRDLSQVRKVATALDLSIDELAFGGVLPKSNFSYELVLYRVSEEQIREKIVSLQGNKII